MDWGWFETIRFQPQSCSCSENIEPAYHLKPAGVGTELTVVHDLLKSDFRLRTGSAAVSTIVSIIYNVDDRRNKNMKDSPVLNINDVVFSKGCAECYRIIKNQIVFESISDHVGGPPVTG